MGCFGRAAKADRMRRIVMLTLLIITACIAAGMIVHYQRYERRE
jgi:hypothetical protein